MEQIGVECYLVATLLLLVCWLPFFHYLHCHHRRHDQTRMAILNEWDEWDVKRVSTFFRSHRWDCAAVTSLHRAWVFVILWRAICACGNEAINIVEGFLSLSLSAHFAWSMVCGRFSHFHVCLSFQGRPFQTNDELIWVDNIFSVQRRNDDLSNPFGHSFDAIAIEMWLNHFLTETDEKLKRRDALTCVSLSFRTFRILRKC